MCKEVDLSLWVGMFPKGADRTPIGPQTWEAADPPWIATSPIKWKPVAATSGQVQFLVESIHQSELEFVLFSNGTTYPHELAVSNPVALADAHGPKHLRLARAADASAMRVSWSSSLRDESAMVHWGTKPLSYTHSASATATTYTKESMCGPPANAHGWVEPPWFYGATLAELPPPGTRIYYSVGSSAMGWSTERSFRVPEAPSELATMKVVVVADVGETAIDGAQYHWMEPFAINTTVFAAQHLHVKQRRKHIGKEGQSYASEAPAELVLHIGDLSYATGYASKWDAFLSQIEVLTSAAPYMTVQGNHERDWPKSGSDFDGHDSGGECGVPTQARFQMPVPDGDQDAGWYSFDQGPVHFVMMNTEMSASKGSPQWEFFAKDLAAVDRALTPWIVFTGHRPMYSSSPGLKQRAAAGVREEGLNFVDGRWWRDVEKLLVQYKVDLCLWGHVHNAELTCPLDHGRCVDPPSPGEYDAPVHAVIGNGGQSLSRFCIGPCCCSSVDPTCEPACLATPHWSKWRMDRFGYATLVAEGSSNLTINFYADCVGEPDEKTMRTCTDFNKLMHTHTISRRPDLWAPGMVV